MLFLRSERALMVCSGRVNLGDVCAARDAITVLRIQPAKSDVISRIHHHCDDVPLADSHHNLKMIVLLRQYSRLNHLRRKLPRVSAEVLHEPFKISGRGSGGKGCPAPVVQHGSRQIRARRRREPLDDQLSPSQSLLDIRSRCRSNRTLRRTVLPGQPRLDPTYIVVEGQNSRGRRFSKSETRNPHKSQQSHQPPNASDNRKPSRAYTP